MKTTTILRTIATEAAPIAGHALQAARNPFVREGLMLLGTYIAVDLYRYERRTNERRETRENFFDYDKWKETHDEHWTYVKELGENHRKEIRENHQREGELHLQLAEARAEDSGSWEYWADRANELAEQGTQLRHDLADERERRTREQAAAAELRAGPSDLPEALAAAKDSLLTIARMACVTELPQATHEQVEDLAFAAIETVDQIGQQLDPSGAQVEVTDALAVPDDTPGLAEQLLKTAQEHLRRFRHVSTRDPQVPPCTAEAARDHAMSALDELERARSCSASSGATPTTPVSV